MSDLPRVPAHLASQATTATPCRRNRAAKIRFAAPSCKIGSHESDALNGGTVKTRPLVAASLAGVLASGCGLVGNESERQAAVVSGNCFDCHNATEEVADLNLEALSFDAVAADAEIWEKAIRKLRAGLMPPADGGPSLDHGERDALVAWLENEIDRNAAPHLPAPGLHRLNRTEYTNAIREPAGPQHRRRDLPAGGRLQPRVRQHGRDSDDVARAHGGVSVRRPRRSAVSPSAPRPRPRSPCSTRRTTRRRTLTSKGCRSAPGAAC